MEEDIMSKTRIVAVTEPRVEGILTAEDFIAFCARVSNPKNQKNTLTGTQLLEYLLKHKHFSPFEMVNVVIEVETTRDIARQILRHQFKFQELSQRYSDIEEAGAGFSEPRETRLQDWKNRQNSLETDDELLIKSWTAKQQQIIHECCLAYQWALKKGLAKEQARVVLPEGLTMTRMYVNGYLRNWITYCNQRMKPDTQKEHREVASSIWELIKAEFPFLAETVIEL